MPTFIPTVSGIINAGIISFLCLFVLFSFISEIRTAKGSQPARLSIALLTLAYLCFWLLSLLIGQSVFHLKLTPVLAKLSYAILLPYFSNLLLYVLGFHFFFRWSFKNIKLPNYFIFLRNILKNIKKGGGLS